MKRIIPDWLKVLGLSLAFSISNVEIALAGGLSDHHLQESYPPYPYPYQPIQNVEPPLTGLIIGAIVIVAVILIGVAIRPPNKNS
jgi:hypothetical protein